MQTKAAMVMVISKLRTSLPCSSTKGNSSFLISQTINGPRILPMGSTGRKPPTIAARWQNIAHMRSSRSMAGSSITAAGGSALSCMAAS